MEVLDVWHHYRWYIILVCVCCFAFVRYRSRLSGKEIYPRTSTESVKLATHRLIAAAPIRGPASQKVQIVEEKPSRLDDGSKDNPKYNFAPKKNIP